jgi:hypothetical protein
MQTNVSTLVKTQCLTKPCHIYASQSPLRCHLDGAPVLEASKADLWIRFRPIAGGPRIFSKILYITEPNIPIYLHIRSQDAPLIVLCSIGQ